jgi:hypothetical protein
MIDKPLLYLNKKSVTWLIGQRPNMTVWSMDLQSGKVIIIIMMFSVYACSYYLPILSYIPSLLPRALVFPFILSFINIYIFLSSSSSNSNQHSNSSVLDGETLPSFSFPFYLSPFSLVDTFFKTWLFNRSLVIFFFGCATLLIMRHV